jgi:hypothetical protein
MKNHPLSIPTPTVTAAEATLVVLTTDQQMPATQADGTTVEISPADDISFNLMESAQVAMSIHITFILQQSVNFFVSKLCLLIIFILYFSCQSKKYRFDYIKEF